MTESEAKTKWCPFGCIAHVNGATANSRAHNDPDLAQDCAGSACMAWRWHDNDLLTIADQPARRLPMFDEQPDGDPHGECAAEIARLTAELKEARETVDYRNALVRSLADSLKKITFMARTSGGWKPDAELIAACEQAEQLLSLPGMSKVIDERDALRAEVATLREQLRDSRNAHDDLIRRTQMDTGL